MAEPVPLPPDEPDEWVDDMAEMMAEAPPGTVVPTEALPEPAQRWTVTDLGSAEWALGHIRDAEEQMVALGNQAGEWEAAVLERQARIRAWFDKAAAPLNAKVRFFSAHLERYALEQREATKKPSIPLPSGTLRTRSTSAKAFVLDEFVALGWAEKNAKDAVKETTTVKLLVSELRKHVKAVELVTEAKLTLSCGCFRFARDPDGYRLPVGSEELCDEHGPALLGRIDPLATRWVVLADGRQVPGMDVEPGTVTAWVELAP